jgi:hypothetical protein
VCCVFPVLSFGQAPREPRLEVTARAVDDEFIEFDVELRAQEPVEFQESALPWGTAYSVLAALITGQGRCIGRSWPVDDPRPLVVTLHPNERRSGRIDLRRLWPSIAKERRGAALVFFWTFDPKTIDGRSLHRSGGVIYLERSAGK